MSEFEGLVAVVTGGASGIGAATVALLAERGATVAILDRDVSTAAEGTFAVAADVTDRAAIFGAIEQVVAKFGRLDIVINNAGIGATGGVDANDDDEWHSVFDVNVVGMARVTSAALPHLRRSPSAAIVNTASVAALVGLPDRALYSATKGAVVSLTLAMATDHLKDGIRVNAVAPGTADTPWVARLLAQAEDVEATSAALRARQPMGRLVTAAEVANAIVYLASPLSSSTTGTILSVDGGMATLKPST